MNDELSASIEKLRETSTRLNQLTDEANYTVQALERFLSDECSIGVFASVIVKSGGSGSEYAGSQYLEYRRVGSKYRIAVVWGDESQDEAVKPWSDCSRDVKLESVQMLPELLLALSRNVDQQVEAAEKATESVSQVLKTFKGKEA